MSKPASQPILQCDECGRRGYPADFAEMIEEVLCWQCASGLDEEDAEDALEWEEDYDDGSESA